MPPSPPTHREPNAAVLACHDHLNVIYSYVWYCTIEAFNGVCEVPDVYLWESAGRRGGGREIEGEIIGKECVTRYTAPGQEIVGAVCSEWGSSGKSGSSLQ